MSQISIEESTTPNEEWEQFKKAVPLPPLVGSPSELRLMVNGFKALNPPTDPVGMTIRNETIAGFEGASNQVRVYTPLVKNTNDGIALAPVIAYIHGGGWTIGDLDSEDSTCRLLCEGTQSVVVSIDYRKAPEHPFPTGLEDAWEAIKWLFANIKNLGGDENKVLIGGNSAGANFTAVLTQRARDSRGQYAGFRGQILRNPFVCHPDAHPKDTLFPSYQENANADILPAEAVHRFLSYYDPGIPWASDVRISPLLAEDLSGLPPAYIQISGADPLRDDGVAYARKLEEAKVSVTVSLYPGLPHSFFAVPSLEVTKTCNQDLVQGALRLLERK